MSLHRTMDGFAGLSAAGWLAAAATACSPGSMTGDAADALSDTRVNVDGTASDGAIDALPVDRVIPTDTVSADGTAIDAPVMDAPIGADVPVVTDVPAPPGDAGVTMLTFVASDEVLVNPERGFFASVSFDSTSNPTNVRAAGFSLGFMYVTLPIAATVDPALITRIGAGLDRVRAAGLKVILRFAYNRADGGPDMPLSAIQRHIMDLTSVVRSHSDVIAVLQGGFIGPYGEWHHFGTVDTNMLDNPTAHRAILEAELAMMPNDRTVAVRTPRFKHELYGGPLDMSMAFATTPIARLSHHNDCFLSDASATDQGTFIGTGMTTAAWRSFAAAETQFVGMGGETCPGSGGAPPSRSDCPTALADMALMHWSYLNSEWAPNIRTIWMTGGCLGEIERRLGYRFSLTRAAYTARVAPGGVLSLTLAVRNSGFATTINPRQVHIVLDGGSMRRTVALRNLDVRRWPAGSESEFSAQLRIPANTTPGTYRVALWLPDDATALRTRPEYSIRLANTGVWNATAGDNTIVTDLVIDTSAPGPTDATSTAFIQLP